MLWGHGHVTVKPHKTQRARVPIPAAPIGSPGTRVLPTTLRPAGTGKPGPAAAPLVSVGSRARTLRRPWTLAVRPSSPAAVAGAAPSRACSRSSVSGVRSPATGSPLMSRRGTDGFRRRGKLGGGHPRGGHPGGATGPGPGLPPLPPPTAEAGDRGPRPGALEAPRPPREVRHISARATAGRPPGDTEVNFKILVKEI